MCTLSITFTHKGKPVIAHNRDEDPNRIALPPQSDFSGPFNLWYPTDTRSGGTWFGYSSAGFGLCILNGGFEKHVPKPLYRKSRGLVALELLKIPHSDILKAINHYDFSGIEPFTMIVFTNATKISVVQYVWNGISMDILNIGKKSTLWSSSTLYSEDQKQRKQYLYEQMVLEQKRVTLGDIELFHVYRGTTSKEGITIERKNIQTLSTTILDLNSLELNYIDNLSLENSFQDPLDLYLSDFILD